MLQKKRGNKQVAKWLRLAVGVAVLAGTSGAVMPGMASAVEKTVDDSGNFYSELWGKSTDTNNNDFFYPGDDGATTGNVVTFSNFPGLGYDLRFGAAGSKTDAITGNQLLIKNSTVQGVAFGGLSEGEAEVSGNVVTIGEGTKVADGGTLQVFGGYSFSTADNIKNNTVNILTAIELDALKGGENSNYSAGKNGNTLNIAAKNVKTNWFGGFENINFFLPQGIADGDTMLTINNGGNALDMSGINVGVTALQGVELEKGAKLNLVVDPNGINNAPTATTKVDKKNVKLVTPDSLLADKEYVFGLSSTETALVATLNEIKEVTGGDDDDSGEEINIAGTTETKASTIKNSQRLKSIVETQAAATTVLNSGVDLLTGDGFHQAKVAADTTAGKFSPFAAIGGSKLRAKSGSYVDTKGYGANIGFAREVKKGNKTYLFAPVVEYGRGSYDSYQDNGLKADGKSRFWGVGMLGRQTNSHGLYVEGSLRTGKLKSDYNGQLSNVTRADYESDSKYWGAHLGCGMVKQFNGGNSLDTYAKYFYSRQDGDKVKVNLNGGARTDEITFDAVESERLRLGTRLSHQLGESNSIYVGAAYQYETKGDARAIYNGSETATPSVKGSSVLFELGWQLTPGKSPVAIDLGVNGWAGKQRGITGKLGFKYNF